MFLLFTRHEGSNMINEWYYITSSSLTFVMSNSWSSREYDKHWKYKMYTIIILVIKYTLLQKIEIEWY